MIEVAHFELLRASGAHRAPHSGRSLLAHLAGTHDLLASWGAPRCVRLAGLFHSIYGTNAFRRQSIPFEERPRVSALIGVEAERLAYLFCAVDRPRALIDAWRCGAFLLRERLSGTDLPIEASELHALLEIECANLIEQSDTGASLRELFFESLAQAEGLSAPARKTLRVHLAGSLEHKRREARQP